MMCTIYDEEQTVSEALKAGASAYILKRSPPHKLLEAIDELHQGGSSMSSSIVCKLGGTFQATAPLAPQLQQLTPREREILEKLGRDFSPREVAWALFVSPTTVRKHIFNIYENYRCILK